MSCSEVRADLRIIFGHINPQIKETLLKTGVLIQIAHNKNHITRPSAQQGITAHGIPDTQYVTRLSLLHYTSQTFRVGLRRNTIP